MAYQYGVELENGMSMNPQQGRSFIPAQSLYNNPNPSAYAPKAPMQPLSQMQNGYGGFQASNFEGIPDLVKQNIMQGSSGLRSSGVYDAYLRHATQQYNGFENNYGVGQVPWALQQGGYNSLLFDPLNQQYQPPNYMQKWQQGNMGGSTSYNPYSGQSLGQSTWSTGKPVPISSRVDNYMYGYTQPKAPSMLPTLDPSRNGGIY